MKVLTEELRAFWAEQFEMDDLDAIEAENILRYTPKYNGSVPPTPYFQMPELRARRECGRERGKEHLGAGIALRGSTYLNGECVPREAPPFRAGVVHSAAQVAQQEAAA